MIYKAKTNEQKGKMRFLVLRRRRLALLAAALMSAAIFAAVNYPAAVSASVATRQLPIYCVERDQKVCSISFDAAWGDVRVRQLILAKFWNHADCSGVSLTLLEFLIVRTLSANGR